MVLFSKEPSAYDLQATGTAARYKYADYTSGLLHHVTISGLEVLLMILIALRFRSNQVSRRL